MRQVVREWFGIDSDPDATGEHWDILDGSPPDIFDLDAVYALDVLEHISISQEDWALLNMREALKRDGVMIIGMPSAESQAHASTLSRMHHVNCKTEDGLRNTMERHFRNVFMFGLNDMTLHTGFGPMTHYRLALCVGKR